MVDSGDGERHTNGAMKSDGRIWDWKRWTLLLAVLAVTAMAFWPSVRFSLVNLDDYGYVLTNADVLEGMSWKGAARAFSPENTAATMYMPLLWLSYMADVSWLGANPQAPWVFHVVNVALHALNAALLFWVLGHFCRRKLVAACLALLWALHPMRVESVAWVTERKDVLSGLFGLLCVGTYLAAWRGRDGWRRWGKLGASVTAFACALLVKPSLVPLPLVLLGLDAWPLGRMGSWREGARCVLEKAIFGGPALVAAWGTVAQHGKVSGELVVPWASRLASMGPNFWFYVRKTVWSAELSPLYPERWAFSWGEIGVALAGLGVLCALALACRRQAPAMGVGWLWFLAFLAPVCGVIPIPMNTVADRFSYFASMGAAMMALPAGEWLAGRWKWAALAVWAALAGVWLWQTEGLLPVWRNSRTLYEKALEGNPGCKGAFVFLLDDEMRVRGDFKGARKRLDELLPKYPEVWELHVLNAWNLAETEGAAAARAYLGAKALPLARPARGDWRAVQAQYALECGDWAEAMRYGEEAMELLPEGATTRTPILAMLMTAAFEAGDGEQALDYGRRLPGCAGKTAITLADTLPHAVYLWIHGRRKAACGYFRRYAEAYGGSADVQNNLAWGLATADWSPADPQWVVGLAERLCGLFGEEVNPGVLDTLAAAQANARDYAGAVATMDRALKGFPLVLSEEMQMLRERMKARKAMYERGEPYREDAFQRLHVALWGQVGRVE